MSKNNNIVDQAPRISWSVIFMAAGMIVSAAFNYATYDTRITVLEKQALQDDGDKKDTQHKIETSIELTQRVDSRSLINEREIANLANRIDKLDTKVDHLMETKKGK